MIGGGTAAGGANALMQGTPPISKQPQQQAQEGHYKLRILRLFLDREDSRVHPESRRSDGKVDRYCRSIGLA